MKKTILRFWTPAETPPRLFLTQVMTCIWCNKKGLLATSGSDGTIRVWNVTKKQYSLQQTCVFSKL